MQDNQSDTHMTSPIRIVEMKLPLTWLLSTATVMVMAIAGLVFQVNVASGGITDLKTAIQDMRKNQEIRDDRMSLLSGSNIETRSQINSMQLELTRLSNDVNEMRRDNRSRYGNESK